MGKKVSRLETRADASGTGTRAVDALRISRYDMSTY
jgi:hypothetical protein